MGFSFTDPLGALSTGIGSLAGGFGGFASDLFDVGTSLFEQASPILSFLGDVGVLGGPSQRQVVASPNARVTSPAGPGAFQEAGLGTLIGPLAGGARRLAPIVTGPTARGVGIGALAGELLEGVGSFFEGGDGAMANGGLTIQPVVGTTPRYPRTVQALVRTASGNTRVITYRNMGSPILYSGDLAAKKRVNRVRGRLGKR